MSRKKSSPSLEPIDLQQMYGYKAEDFTYNYLETAKKVEKQFGEVVRPRDCKFSQFAIDDHSQPFFYAELGRKGIHLRKEHLLLDELSFMTMISLLSLPYGYFRGSIYRLLCYMGYKKAKRNNMVQKFIEVLKTLQDNKYIIFEIEWNDKPHCHYYDIFVKKYINVDDGDLWLPFDVARKIRKFMDENRIQEGSYFKLLKVWISMQNQPYEKKFGYFEIQRDTGLTKNQVIDMIKWLKQMSVLEDIVKVGSAFKRKADGSVLQLEQKL